MSNATATEEVKIRQVSAVAGPNQQHRCCPRLKLPQFNRQLGHWRQAHAPGNQNSGAPGGKGTSPIRQALCYRKAPPQRAQCPGAVTGAKLSEKPGPLANHLVEKGHGAFDGVQQVKAEGAPEQGR